MIRRSLKHIYAQLVDDTASRTLMTVSSHDIEGKKTEMAGWEDASAAKTAITNCQKRFSQARGKAAMS